MKSYWIPKTEISRRERQAIDRAVREANEQRKLTLTQWIRDACAEKAERDAGG